MGERNVSYITLLSTPDYLGGEIVLYKSLRRYSQIPFHCVCSKYLPEDCIKNLNANGIETIRLTESAIDIVNVSLPKAGIGLEHWNNTFDKLLIWGLTQF